jgi:hypothetical protein
MGKGENMTQELQTELQAPQLVDALQAELTSVQAHIAELETQEKRLRAEISIAVNALGGKYQNATHAYSETVPFLRTGWDSKALDDVVQELVLRGFGDIAKSLLECKKVTPVAGSLRIEKIKTKREENLF